MLTLACIIAILLLVVVRLERWTARSQVPAFRVRPQYAGSSIMDRVAAAGLLKDLDAAVESRDIKTIVAILQQIEVGLPDALAIGEAMINNRSD